MVPIIAAGSEILSVGAEYRIRVVGAMTGDGFGYQVSFGQFRFFAKVYKTVMIQPAIASEFF